MYLVFHKTETAKKTLSPGQEKNPWFYAQKLDFLPLSRRFVASSRGYSFATWGFQFGMRVLWMTFTELSETVIQIPTLIKSMQVVLLFRNTLYMYFILENNDIL